LYQEYGGASRITSSSFFLQRNLLSKLYRFMRAGVNRAFGLHRPERNLDVFADDVFLTSYPKSGNTWTRFLIANLVFPDQTVNFDTINELVPDPYALSKRRLARIPRPRFIKSHEYFDPRYRRVIYVVRDPRDVALSQYHFHRKRRVIEDTFPIERFVTHFIAGETSPYGSWGENVSSWLATMGKDPNFLLIRYEDLIQSTTAELERVARFLQLDASPERLARAAALSSAENMRELERAGAKAWSSTKDTRQDIPFVRRARAGDWTTDLPLGCVAQIEEAWGGILQELGYPITQRSEMTA
jgi:hypothetical protein